METPPVAWSFPEALPAAAPGPRAGGRLVGNGRKLMKAVQDPGGTRINFPVPVHL